jgi:hypothetical protein
VICKTKEKKKGGIKYTSEKRKQSKKYNNPFNCRNGDAECKKCQNEMILTQTQMQTSQRYHSDRLHQLNRWVQLSIRFLSAYVFDVFDIGDSAAIRPSILCLHPLTLDGRLNEGVRTDFSIEISVHSDGPSIF